MGVAEGNAGFDEVIGQVGGQQHRVGGGAAAIFLAEFHRSDQLGVDGEDQPEGVHGIKERRFIFLEVAIVGERQAFESHQ